MGKSYTPKYRIETVEWRPGVGAYKGTFAWDGKRDGKPSAAAASKWRESMNKSFEAGGVNAHLAGTRIGSIKIVEQATGSKVAEFNPPMFEVI
jgi:hypothetical protein